MLSDDMLERTPPNYMATLKASAPDEPAPEARKGAPAGTRVQADLSALAVRTPLPEPDFEWSGACGVQVRYHPETGTRGWWIREAPGHQSNGMTVWDAKVWAQILKWAAEGKLNMHFSPKRGPQAKPKKEAE